VTSGCTYSLDDIIFTNCKANGTFDDETIENDGIGGGLFISMKLIIFYFI
jgi:hypothetical protein